MKMQSPPYVHTAGMTTKIDKCYSELIQLPTFEERFEYCKLNGVVGVETFGYDRYLNQRFYQSPIWKHIRSEVILRDNGCDLGIPDRPIGGSIYIHHLIPITPEDIIKETNILRAQEYLICTSYDTHYALHYGSEPRNVMPVERTKYDTCPWRK